MFSAIALLVLSAVAQSAASSAADPYAPLRLYQGSWRVAAKDIAAGAKPDTLENQCALIGKFFGCQQTVNGKVGALILFIPTDHPGHYYTQAVMPEGWAKGRGELEIQDEHWTYSSKEEENGKTTYYRTVNIFTGKDHIHFELQDSADGKEFTTRKSGDEDRIR